MNLDLLPFFTLASLAANWFSVYYTYQSNKSKATNERIEALEAQMAQDRQAHADRIARLETIAENAPTHTDLGKVYEKVNSLAQSSSRMEGQLAGMDSTLRLILNRVAEKGMK